MMRIMIQKLDSNVWIISNIIELLHINFGVFFRCIEFRLLYSNVSMLYNLWTSLLGRWIMYGFWYVGKF